VFVIVDLLLTVMQILVAVLCLAEMEHVWRQ
jgi:hypothetical protein